MEIILLIVRLFLAVIFVLAGIGKLLDLEGSEKAVKDFGVPEVLAKPFSIILPIAEISLAILLLFVETSWFGAIGGSLLLLSFIGGMLYQMAQGNAPDCHCFGQIHSEPVGKKSLIRNAVFAILGIVLVFSGQSNQGLNLFSSDFNSIGNTDFMQIFIGSAIVVLLAAIVHFLKQISAQQVQIMRRIEILEVISSGESKVEREHATHPEDGLPIGAPAPDFVLPDVNGRNVAFEHLLAQAKPLLFFFVSPTCTPCKALLPEINEWQKDLGEKINFVFISNGKVKDNLEKFGETTKQILIQKDREVAIEFEAIWTPTALLVNSDGTTGSRAAAGDEAIRELIEKLKAESPEKDSLYISNGETGARKSKIGEKIPQFNIEDLKGRKIGEHDFRGKKTLVTFWSTTCPYCVNMLEDLREWEKIKGQDEPNLMVFSDGELEAHEKLDLNSPIILDKDYKIAGEIGMSGTPSAILVNETGEIISETAIGAPQIWALLGRKNKLNGKTD
jgi:thiol-disulfide isomerase/thioredoxin